MAEAFCKVVVKHKQGEKKDMDVAVFGAFDSNLVGFLVVRCVKPFSLACSRFLVGKGSCSPTLLGYVSMRFPFSFLVEYCELNLDGALEEFAVASPPGIYSRRYLEVCSAPLRVQYPHSID